MTVCPKAASEEPEDGLRSLFLQLKTERTAVTFGPAVFFYPRSKRHQDTNGDGTIDERDSFVDINRDGKLDAKDHVSTVTAERTVLLEEYDVAAIGTHTISFEIIDSQGVSAMYKKYILTEGHQMLVPKNPTVNFDGYWYLDGQTRMTREQIKQLPVDQNYRFTNRRIR